MCKPFNFDDNQDISQMDSQQKTDYLKGFISGRDPKSGKFLKGHSGNTKGRPRARTNTKDCLSAILSQKTNITVMGKPTRMTLLEAYCNKLVMSVLSCDDPKLLIQAFKSFYSNIDISKEFPEPKIRPLKKDPTIDIIKNAIFNSVDEECGVNHNYGDENNLIE